MNTAWIGTLDGNRQHRNRHSLQVWICHEDKVVRTLQDIARAVR